MVLNIAIRCLKYICPNRNTQKLLIYSLNVRYFDKQYLFTREFFQVPFTICTKSFCTDVPVGENTATPVKPRRKKTVEEPKITLYDENKNHITSTLPDANKLAKSKKLKLIKVQDAGSNSKAVYKLVPLFEFISEASPSPKRVQKKNKHLAISSRITDHDLDVKIKAIKKALMKDYNVQIALSKEGGDTNVQSILKKIEGSVKGIGLIDKKISLANPKFIIKPVQDKEKPEISETSSEHLE